MRIESILPAQITFQTGVIMRRLNAFLLGIFMAFGIAAGGVGVSSSVSADAEGREVYVGGMPAGFTLSAGGAQVIGLSEVMNDKGVSCPAADAGIRTGDVIVKAAGIQVETVGDLNEILGRSKGKAVGLEIRRGDSETEISVTPVKDKVTGKYKIGVLIRDSVSGIGTVTYIDKQTKRFGSLGHSVVGEDHREMKIAGGKVYECSIVGVSKGVRGKAGELRGMFLSEGGIGKAEKLCDCGIYGQVNESYELSGLQSVYTSDIDEVQPGDAYIYSTVSGVCPKKYTIDIVKVEKNNKSNKNFVIKITDKELISETGGIVQGMSGSPILQDGKLVGAVTHVFLNDPTRGYGIDINTMLKE